MTADAQICAFPATFDKLDVQRAAVSPANGPQGHPVNYGTTAQRAVMERQCQLAGLLRETTQSRNQEPIAQPTR